MKKALIVIAIFIVLFTLPRLIIRFIAAQNEPKSVYQYSKAEYVEEATKNCTKDGSPESVCRCFYSGYLENHTVAETLKFDTEASANPDTYRSTQEQKQLLANCME